MRVGRAEHPILYTRQAPGDPCLTRPVFSPGRHATLPLASGDVSRDGRGYALSTAPAGSRSVVA
jgi:hypothetical protein